MKKNLLALMILLGIATNAVANSGTAPIVMVNGNTSCPTCVTGSSPTNHGVAVGGSGQALTYLSVGSTNQVLLGNTGADPAFGSLADAHLPATALLESDVGAGLSVTSNTINVASTEAGFLTDGGASALTCGGSAQGKMQVMDDGTLQYCDGASTSVLKYAALADSAGRANVTLALRSATTDVNVSSATAPSAGQVLKATSNSAATWQSDNGGEGIHFMRTETPIAAGSTTVFGNPNGALSTTSAAVVAAPVAVSSGNRTLSRLRCFASASTTNNLVVTMGLAPNNSGVCGTFDYTSKPTVTLTGTTKVADTSNTLVAAENECVALKYEPASTSADVFVMCSWVVS